MQHFGSYDYVIAGAGSAGCLLEAGGPDDYFWIDIPVGYLYTIGNPRTDWCYRTEPGNTNAPTYVIAEKAARAILKP